MKCLLVKRIVLLCFFLSSVGLYAQNFNIEYKCFLLQSHFKSRHIKSVIVQESSDSLFKNRTIQYELEFDNLGRLIQLKDYFFSTDTIAERMITYAYKGEMPYYNQKIYHYLDSDQNTVLKKVWVLNFDKVSHVLEEQIFNKTESYRTNRLVFNQSMQLMSRTVQAFAINLRTQFIYDKAGLIKHVKLIKNNPTVERKKNLELNQYLQYNLYQKIMTTEQWEGERNRQLNEYYYNYKNQNILTKVGWRLLNWKDNRKVIERTNFKYDQYGLLVLADYFTEKQVSKIHKYTGFNYTFFEGKGRSMRGSDMFTTIWFTDMFAENLVHP